MERISSFDVWPRASRRRRTVWRRTVWRTATRTWQCCDQILFEPSRGFQIEIPLVIPVKMDLPLTDDICRFRNRPLSFLARYVRRRRLAHGVIILAVLGAVTCSVSTQYGVKFHVDVLSREPGQGGSPWLAFAILVSFVAADNLLWRGARWVARLAFVKGSGGLRCAIF